MEHIISPFHLFHNYLSLTFCTILFFPLFIKIEVKLFFYADKKQVAGNFIVEGRGQKCPKSKKGSREAGTAGSSWLWSYLYLPPGSGDNHLAGLRCVLSSPPGQNRRL